ncbi:MAG: porin [Bradyrhizobium sp.]|nr:porin [Bradyrhizobium sp.]
MRICGRLQSALPASLRRLPGKRNLAASVRPINPTGKSLLIFRNHVKPRTPVKNLAFSAEVQWFHLDQKFAGVATLGPTAPKAATVYEFKDQDTFLLQLRAQRNF